jgi:hypothetical protein
MKTSIYELGSARFDMTGRSLPPYLTLTTQQISTGLASRIQRYAVRRLTEAGFTQAASWEAEVYLLSEGWQRSSERGYTVRFQNAVGGYVEVVGILCNKGWPHLDHGLDIGEDRI